VDDGAITKEGTMVMEFFSIRLPAKLKEQCRRAADAQGHRSVSRLIREVLEREFKEPAKSQKGRRS
jgi:metal-responsive CopG/Arc/MetJ family transcriptional regulator